MDLHKSFTRNIPVVNEELSKLWKAAASEQELFEGFFNIVRCGISVQCGLYFWKNWSNLYENFI